MDASITRASADAYGPRFPADPAGGGRWTDVSTSRSTVNLGLPRFSANVATARSSARANVMASCLVRAGDLNFGDYVASADLADDLESEIRVTCSAGGRLPAGRLEPGADLTLKAEDGLTGRALTWNLKVRRKDDDHAH